MTESQAPHLKQQVIDERGYWAPFHDVLLHRAPDFLQAYLDFQAGPARRQAIGPVLRELIYVAVDVSINHRYPTGAQRHMTLALRAGAEPAAVLQTVLIATVLAARQPIELGLEILAEETAGNEGDRGVEVVATSWHAYDLAACQAGPLTPKERALIALAVCAAPDCLFEPGLREHMRGAIMAGASTGEIASVLQLAAAISIHSCTTALPALEDAIASQQSSQTQS